MAVLHFTDAQRDEQLLAGQKVAELALMHQASPLFCDRCFVHLYSPLLEKAMAPHSSTLAWKIPWVEEPDRLQSTGSQRVGQDGQLHLP